MNAKAQKKKILITGVSGLLGSNLAVSWRERYDIFGIYHEHAIALEGVRLFQADITDKKALSKIMAEIQPDVVVHCAALANVDFCEDHQDLTRRVNVEGTKNLIESLKNTSAKFVYISTDAVYGGDRGNFAEDDTLNPLNYYARTKKEGEEAALKYKNTLIIRTAFFGWNAIDKKNLAEHIIHKLSSKETIQGWTDVHTSMLYTSELADLLEKMIEKDLKGIYNCASRDSRSKYEFAAQLADQLGLERSFIQPVSIEKTSLKAKRSKKLDLNVSKLSQALGEEMPSMLGSIQRFAKDYQEGLPSRLKANFSQVYPILNYLSYGRQSIDETDIAAVVEVLKAASITQGPKIKEFESKLSQVAGSRFTIAVNSGTSALHIGCLAAGVGPGDEVITSPNTFVASANCVIYCGGKPVFADIDPRTYNISPENIASKINEKTKAVIAVHFAGQSCDMEEIRRVVTEKEKQYGHKIFIIEDAAHALGSVYRQAKVGSCKYSDMTVMSFHPVKHITTGEGGAVATNDEVLFSKLKRLRSHGITSTPEEFTNPENSVEAGAEETLAKPWYYEQNSLGFNYRITDIQCALGLSQLNKLPRFIQRRREIVDQYNEAFGNMEWITPPFESKLCTSNFHLYVLRFDFGKIGMTRTELILHLRKKGIQTQVHYIPVYTQPFYKEKFQLANGLCPQAEKYYEECLSIPLYPEMSADDVRHVVQTIKDIKSHIKERVSL